MAKKLVCALVLLVLCGCIPRALAMGEVVEVTKETQARVGLNYTLVADRVDAEAVLVSMEIPRKGKLKDVRSVSMRIGGGRPLVDAPLLTTTGKNGAWVVTFQLSPELAEKCSVDLIVPTGNGAEYLVYAVEVKGYVKARK